MASDELLWMAWTQCWQLTMLVVTVWLIVRWCCQSRPHLAHGLWLLVLAKCVTPPVWSCSSGVFCWLQPERVSTFATDPLLPIQATRQRPNTIVFASSPPTGDAFEAQEEHSAPVRTEFSALMTAEVEQSPSRMSHAIPMFITMWLAGTGTIVLLAGWRWFRCWKMIREANVERRDDLQELIGTLTTRLGIRRSVRLLVTCSRIGPAVVGIWRPVILLPKIVVQHKSAEDLEPILAHELLHVRRGDLLVGMGQLVAQSLWWFHPLIWLANRCLCRDAERCCDEEVIAELDCDPARYARNLIDVLELKRALQPIPAFPGVRPVEVTSRRLERIMKLGHGCRKQTPWQYRLLMFLVAAMTLPGAAFVAGGGRMQRNMPTNSDRQAAPEPSKTSSGQQPGPSEAPLEIRVYAVKDVLRQVQDELKCSDSDAKQTLLEMLPGASGMRTNEPEPRFQWSNRRLVVRHTTSGHARIAQRIEFLRENGIQQVVIEAHMISGSPDAIARLHSRWEVVDVAVPADNSDGNSRFPPPSPFVPSPLGKSGVQLASMEETIEKRLPALCAVLEDHDVKVMQAKVRSSSQLWTEVAPKIMSISGQDSVLTAMSERRFVVGFEKLASAEHKPQIRVVPIGWSMRVLALPQRDNQINLECELELSRIIDVEVRTLSRGPLAEPLRVQVPEVVATKLHLAYNLPLGQTLLIGGLKNRSEEGQPLATLIMLRCTKSSDETVIASDKNDHAELDSNDRRKSDAPQRIAYRGLDVQTYYVQTYYVADLVVPVPKVVPIPVSGRTDEKTDPTNPPSPKSAAINFDRLTNLIKSTDSPESWKRQGGGAIESFPTNLSLVVRQTRAVHEQIAAHLEQLRQAQDVQVSFRSQVLTLPKDFFGPAGIEFMAGEAISNNTRVMKQRSWQLTAKQTDLLLQAAGEDSRTNRLDAPTMTLFQGQSAWLNLGDQDRHFFLQFQANVSKDRKSTAIRFLIGPDSQPDDALIQQPPVEMAGGDTLLIDITESLPSEVLDRNGATKGAPSLDKVPYLSRLFQPTSDRGSNRTYLLVTTRILVVEDKGIVPES